MKSLPLSEPEGPARQYAAKIFYFCYCALKGDQIAAETASRRVLAFFAPGPGLPEGLRQGAALPALLSLEACGGAERLGPERAGLLLWHIFRLEPAQIARLIGYGPEQTETLLAGPAGKATGRVPLLPLLEGECLSLRQRRLFPVAASRPGQP